jgi:hypothetical protein
MIHELKSTISFCLNHPEPVLATHDRYTYAFKHSNSEKQQHRNAKKGFVAWFAMR